MIVKDIGALAGLAASVGLAVLLALHISHARDLKRLRDWVGGAPERSTPGVPVFPGPRQNEIEPSRRSKPWHRRIGVRPVAAGVVGLLVLGVATSRLTGHHDPHDSGTVQARKPTASPDAQRRSGAAVKAGDVTVAALNGTTVPGLAAAMRDRVGAAGFKEGVIDVSSNQQLALSVVQYVPGHQAEAQVVGRRLGISQREPISAGSRVLAGDATVVVIVGADRAP